jgi:hypothetical protein
VRCLREAQVQRRRSVRRLAIAGLAAFAVLGVLGVARAHMMRVANTPASPPAPVLQAPDGPSMASEVDAIVNAPVPRVPDTWSATLADLDAERAAQAQRQEAMQRRLQADALVVPTVPAYQRPAPVVASPPPPAPGFGARPTRYYSRGLRGGWAQPELQYVAQNGGRGAARVAFIGPAGGQAGTLAPRRIALGR